MHLAHGSLPTLKQTYHLDPNHVGLRLAVLFAMIVSAGLGMFVIMPAALHVLPFTGVPELCFTVVGTLLIGIGASWAVETALRSIWPSGRVLEVEGNAVTLRRPSAEAVTIDLGSRTNVLAWYFVIRRGRTWVPRGWYCVACCLTQDERVIIPYSFVKPDIARAMPQWSAFEELISRKQAPRPGEEHLLKKVGEQGQIRAAERDRWEDGVEMRVEDFAAFVALLDARMPDWPAAGTAE